MNIHDPRWKIFFKWMEEMKPTPSEAKIIKESSDRFRDMLREGRKSMLDNLVKELDSARR